MKTENTSKQNLQVVLTVGIPASGKSTWAKNFVEKNPKWVIVNRDSFRSMLRNEQFCERSVEDLITKLFTYTVIQSLLSGKNVIADNTHLKVKYIENFIKDVKYYADISFRIFDVPIDVAIERDANREKSVGKKVIERMKADYENLLFEYTFTPISKVLIPHSGNYTIPKNTSKRKAVIFDIDGTIAVNMGRSPFSTNEELMTDDINQHVLQQINFYKKEGYAIIFLSGRAEDGREFTEKWLNQFISDYTLIMRPNGNYSKDSYVKTKLYEEQIEPNYTVQCVFDDRIQVVKMWAELGVFCFCVNQGLYEF